MKDGNDPLALILLNGEFRPARPVGTFTAFDPTTGEPLPGLYPVSAFEDAEEAIGAGRAAARILADIPPADLAGFFDLLAETILKQADDLVEIAHRETALPKEPRLRSSELPRTTGQLHQAAEAVRDGSWRQAAIDSRPNIRSIREPLDGPVVVFGPSNFPFAFNAAAGGDFASALAAGNPVIAKAHPSHPGTTLMFGGIVLDCLRQTGLPAATLQIICHLEPEDGRRLVAHPGLGATAFTGSRPAGLALKKAADDAGRTIYLEMSGLNPVFLLPEAVRTRGVALAAELFASCSLGAGQFCTKPGLTVLLNNDDGKMFAKAIRKHFQSPPAGYLFNRNGLAALEAAVACLRGGGAELLAGGKRAEGPGYRFENTLFQISGRDFLKNPEALQQEAFGTATLLVLAETEDAMAEIAGTLEGTLGLSVYSGPTGTADEAFYERLAPVLRSKTGRLLNDKMPTGLAVVPSMVHGGPYPASGHPGFTSVGLPASLLRFTALRCYDNIRPERLPIALRDRNPNGRMWRLIDGSWTQADAPPAKNQR